MNLSQNRRAAAAFSWLELLVVIATVMLLVGVFYLWQPQLRSKRVTCVNNLKYVGLATRVWASDSMDGFAWTHKATVGGTLEYKSSPEVFRHFDTHSKQLSSPKLLVCPSDPNRFPAASFGPPLSNSNISYFLCFDALETKPQIPLSGDRNITGGKSNAAGLVFAPSDIPGWDASLHHFEGNLGLSDGSVQQVTTQALARQFAVALTQTGYRAPIELRLAIPRVAHDETAGRAFMWSEGVVPVAGVVSITLLLGIAWWLIRRQLETKPSEEKEL